MRVHDCLYKVVNSDHMQISFEAKIIRSKEPKRLCYDLTAFRQLALPQVDFLKNSHEVVLNKRGDDPRSREKLK